MVDPQLLRPQINGLMLVGMGWTCVVGLIHDRICSYCAIRSSISFNLCSYCACTAALLLTQLRYEDSSSSNAIFHGTTPAPLVRPWCSGFLRAWVSTPSHYQTGGTLASPPQLLRTPSGGDRSPMNLGRKGCRHRCSVPPLTRRYCTDLTYQSLV